MNANELSTLLEEIISDEPCGPNLEYDPAFIELESAARGKPEQQEGEEILPAEDPDWPVVRDLAVELLSRTKDLRVVVLLARSWVHTGGFQGLRDGLELIHVLIDEHWEAVHPRLDPEDDNDPTMRMNVIESLSDRNSMLIAIREAPLVNSKLLGTYGLHQIELAKQFGAESKEDDSRVSMSTIDAAFLDCDLEELRRLEETVNQCQRSLEGIDSVLMERVGSLQAPDLSGLSGVLREAQLVLSEKTSVLGPTGGEEGDASVADSAAPQTIRGEVSSREDVLRTLDRICDYYERNEPSSPVPLLLRRAKRLVPKDFMEIIRDMAPEGVSQAETIAGVENHDEDFE